MHEIAFWVDGEPAPQGSKIRNRYGGVREDNPKTAPWRGMVAWRARETMGAKPVIEGPVSVTLTFQFARPASHFGTGRNAGKLRMSAPEYPAVKPDVDKLERAVLDSLSGIVIRDDARVVSLFSRKLYGRPGVSVVVTPM